MAIRVTRGGVWLAVGIIVLAALIFGGLYLVRERGEQARREDAIAIAEQNLEEQSNEGTPIVVEEETAEEEASGEETAPNGTEQQSDATSPSELPATGATANALFVLAVIAFAATSYGLSVRQLHRTQ